MNRLIRWTLATAMTLGLVGLSASREVHAGLILDMTGGTALTNSAGTVTYGWSFQVNSAVDIDGLGLWDEGSNGLVASHQIGLWNSAGTLVTSIVLSNANSTAVDSQNAAGRWLFADITRRTLTTGIYTVGAVYTSDDLLRTQTSAPIMAAGVNYLGNRFDISGFTYPTNNATFQGNAYFGPNLRTAAVVVPEPASLVLVGLGLASIGFVAHRGRPA